MKEVLIVINEEIWECLQFIGNHPGEGISDIYLEQFHRKDCSVEFEKFHNVNEPDEWMENARKLKPNPSDLGLRCILKSNPFGKYSKSLIRVIPAYFHSDLTSLELAQKELQDCPDEKAFILAPHPQNESHLLLFSKEKDKFSQTVLQNVQDKWQFESDPSKSHNFVEKLIEEQFTKQGFKGI